MNTKFFRKFGFISLFSSFLSSIFLALSTPLPATAKDLTHRLSVGYRNQLWIDAPAIATQYYSTKDLAVGASLGILSGNSDSRLALGARVHKVIFPEDNLNFYMGTGGGILSTSGTGRSTDSGFELSGFFGAEFFIPGIDSLAINFEAGVGVVSLPSGVIFRTFGDSPLRAGMLFYF